MALVWMVDCKICALRFAVLPREKAESGKSTDQLVHGKVIGTFECSHCHEPAEYSTDDCIPGESKHLARKR